MFLFFVLRFVFLVFSFILVINGSLSKTLLFQKEKATLLFQKEKATFLSVTCYDKLYLKTRGVYIFIIL